MLQFAVFLSGMGATMVFAWLVLRHLRPHLLLILQDVCETRERAAFWTAFSMATVGLAPVICAMQYEPSGPPWALRLCGN